MLVSVVLHIVNIVVWLWVRFSACMSHDGLTLQHCIGIRVLTASQWTRERFEVSDLVALIWLSHTHTQNTYTHKHTHTHIHTHALTHMHSHIYMHAHRSLVTVNCQLQSTRNCTLCLVLCSWQRPSGRNVLHYILIIVRVLLVNDLFAVHLERSMRLYQIRKRSTCCIE